MIKVIGERTEERRLFTQDEKKQILKRSYGICACCGRKLNLKSMTVEHIIPLIRGGKNEMENLIALCYDCNQLKGNMLYLPYGFYNALQDKPVFDEMERYVRDWFKTIKDEFDFERFPLIAPRFNFQVGLGLEESRIYKRQPFIRQLLLQWQNVGTELYAEVEAVTGINIEEVRQGLRRKSDAKDKPVALYVLKKPSDDKLLAVIAVAYEKNKHCMVIELTWSILPKAYVGGAMVGLVHHMVETLENIAETDIYQYVVMAKSYEAVAEFNRDENGHLGKSRRYIQATDEETGEINYHIIDIMRETPAEKAADEIRENLRKRG